MNITRLLPYYDELLELPTNLIGGPYHGQTIPSVQPRTGHFKPPRYIIVRGKRGGRKAVRVVYERRFISELRHCWTYVFAAEMRPDDIR
jgi:hypothetical protein